MNGKTCSVLMMPALMLAAPVVAQTVSVAGSSNPFLAGQPAGTTCCSGDVAPGQSPVFATAVTAGQKFTFSATGGADYSGGVPGTSPDGDNNGTSYTYRLDMAADYGTGISGPLGVNIDGLVGVFIGSGVPGGTAPGQLNFTASGMSTGLDFLTLAPGLNQIFWIGDGLTGLGTGTVQQFTAPVGATRLFLGTVDGFGWYNNSGTIRVTINALPGAVPEPASWALMLLGFGAVGYGLRRQRARIGAIA